MDCVSSRLVTVIVIWFVKVLIDECIRNLCNFTTLFSEQLKMILMFGLNFRAARGQGDGMLLWSHFFKRNTGKDVFHHHYILVL